MKRRDFLKKSSLVFAVPAIAVVAKTGMLQAAEPEAPKLCAPKLCAPKLCAPKPKVPAHKYTDLGGYDLKLGKFPLLNEQRYQWMPKMFRPAYWRGSSTAYVPYDSYFNNLIEGWMTYRESKEAGGFWVIVDWVGDGRSRKGLPCPKCLQEIQNDLEPWRKSDINEIDQALSVVCNTWPYGEVPKWCMCGHEWLKYAHEDYKLWNYGNGERWNVRAQRHKYMTEDEWFNHVWKHSGVSQCPSMSHQPDVNYYHQYFNLEGVNSGRLDGLVQNQSQRGQCGSDPLLDERSEGTAL